MNDDIGEFVYRPNKAREYVARLHRARTGSILEVSVEADSVALALSRTRKMYPDWKIMELQWSWDNE